jgi:hypothetical protein
LTVALPVASGEVWRLSPKGPGDLKELNVNFN